jgi:hypothetical protein
MVLGGNSNQGLLRWFEQQVMKRFKLQGSATRSPECKEHLQNRSVGGRPSERDRVVAPGRATISARSDDWKSERQPGRQA